MTRANHRARGAFTLVELLVVIGILAVLATMSIGAVLRFRGVGFVVATQNTIKAVKNVVERQWKNVADKADREAIPTSVQTLVTFLADVGDPALDQLTAGRARVIYTKLRLKHAFPVSFAEVYADTYPTTPTATAIPLPLIRRDYRDYLTRLGITSANHGSTAFTLEQQSAICLRMILELGPGGDGTSAGELAGATLSLGSSPTGQDVLGLVDGWRNPLILCRFPTGFTKFASGRDPLDPENYLIARLWRQSLKAPPTRLVLGHFVPVQIQMQPVVASKGADGQLGLRLDTFQVEDAALAADNKYTSDY